MPLPKIPIVVLDGQTPVPPNTLCYIVAGNGTFMQQVTPYCTRIIRVEGISTIDRLEPSVTSSLPLIPALVMARARAFFRAVFFRHKAESGLVMYINDETGQWELDCPDQLVSYGGIDYNKKLVRKTGRRLQGSIHSHCDFGAGHSGTDTNDEIDFNGLHLTMGHVNQDRFSLVSSFSFHNDRFQVDPQTVVSGLLEHDQPRHNYQHKFGFSGEPAYAIGLSEQDAAEMVNRYIDEINDEWLPKVKQQTRVTGWSSYIGAGKNYSRHKMYGFQPPSVWHEQNATPPVHQAQKFLATRPAPGSVIPPDHEIPTAVPVDEPEQQRDGGDGTGFNPGLVEEASLTPATIPPEWAFLRQELGEFR
jgi:hypothetical protein